MTARTALGVVGAIAAAIGIAVEVVAITQLRHEPTDRPLFRPRVAVFGGMCLAAASLLSYTILLAGLGALFALAASIALVQEYVQPLQQDSMVAGATSVLVFGLVIWFGAALYYTELLQALAAVAGLSAAAVGLAALRGRSVRAETLHA